MKTQHEKNKEILMEEIEKLCERPMNDAAAAKLSNYSGALKAICLAEKELGESSNAEAARSAERHDPTPELDGDTEFERVIMTIPADRPHMVKLTCIFNKHMEDLKFANNRAYNGIMEQLREVAKS